MAAISPADLVAAAMKGLDVATETDLRDALRTRYGVRPAQSQINRWANGDAQPSYPYTLALLEAAGWLSRDRVEEALAAATLAADEAHRRAERLVERGRPALEQRKRA